MSCCNMCESCYYAVKDTMSKHVFDSWPASDEMPDCTDDIRWSPVDDWACCDAEVGIDGEDGEDRDVGVEVVCDVGWDDDCRVEVLVGFGVGWFGCDDFVCCG